MSYLRESWLRPLVLSGDMLRNRGFVLLTIYNLIYQISTEQVIYNDGWKPMSHTDIYNQLRRESAEYPVYVTRRPLADYDDNLNMVQRPVNSKKGISDENPLYSAAGTDSSDKMYNMRENSKENPRKAKKVWDLDVSTGVNNILTPPDINFKTNITNKEKSNNNALQGAATSKIYEVTEDIEDQSLTTQDYNTTEFIGYQYKPLADEPQNLTSTFYKILSKYNINTDDKLQNYDLSLQHKVRNPSKNVDKVLLPYRYNNLNHLPVDPLLAVFLSNYGFYLPSLYGINANYNNLYGYLASNNIHNNRPFGLYKIFSDTDSWN